MKNCIKNYAPCAYSCSCYWTYDNVYSKDGIAVHVKENRDCLMKLQIVIN